MVELIEKCLREKYPNETIKEVRYYPNDVYMVYAKEIDKVRVYAYRIHIDFVDKVMYYTKIDDITKKVLVSAGVIQSNVLSKPDALSMQGAINYINKYFPDENILYTFDSSDRIAPSSGRESMLEIITVSKGTICLHNYVFTTWSNGKYTVQKYLLTVDGVDSEGSSFKIDANGNINQ